MSTPVSDRPVIGTRKHRMADLEVGDITRNEFGKWARVTGVTTTGLYTTVDFDGLGKSLMGRDVHLVDVQVVKPS